MKTFPARVELLDSADVKAIRGAEPHWVKQTEESGVLGWLPLQANLDLTRAVVRVLGSKGGHEFFAGLGYDAYETPLMKGLVRSVVALVGHDPGRYLDWMQKTFCLIFRDAGEWHVFDREQNQATLEVRALPVICLDDQVWLDSVASSLHALFKLAECDGSVRVRIRDRRRGCATLHLMWNTPGTSKQR